MSPVIEQAFQARVIASAPSNETVHATLRYDRQEPFAVRMSFPPLATLEGTEVTWEFARELLTTGVDVPTGVGDVRVRPFGYGRTVVEFHTPRGTAVLHLRTEELRHFLARAEDLAPQGQEYLFLDLDHDLIELLRDAR